MDDLCDFEDLERLLDLVSSDEEEDIGEDVGEGNEMHGRREYRIYGRKVVDDFDDTDFRRYFRLRKTTFWHLHSLDSEHVEADRRRSRELTAEAKLLGILRYLPCGNFQQTAGDYIGISQPTMSQILIPVCDAILTLFHRYVRMPATEQECLAKSGDFGDIAGFPRCIGAIDYTQIKINSPGGEIVKNLRSLVVALFLICYFRLSIQSEHFRNRKGYFSMNVLTIADARLRIMNVVSRWPGPAHDAIIFAHSEVRRQFERGDFGSYILVGDSGYRNSGYLCTPYRINVQLNAAQRLYQK